MFRFIIYLAFFYFLYIFLKRVFFQPDNSGKEKIRGTKKDKSHLNIDEDNIEDAKFKEIKKGK